MQNEKSTLDRPLIICGEGMTKQSFRDECNINNIMKQYEQKGQLPDMIKANPQYGDFSNVLDYHESLNTIIRAEEQFNALTAEVRSQFDNDPAKMLDFVANPANEQKLIDLGLAIAKPIPEPPKPADIPAEKPV